METRPTLVFFDLLYKQVLLLDVLKPFSLFIGFHHQLMFLGNTTTQSTWKPLGAKGKLTTRTERDSLGLSSV